jgi:HK97 family phage major capsid protein
LPLSIQSPTAAWRAETDPLSESDPVFCSVDLTPRSLSFVFKISREPLSDSANLDQTGFGAIAQAFAQELDRAGLQGSGTAPEIRGILNTTGIQSVTNGAVGAFLAPPVYSNFISGIQAILTANGPMRPLQPS